MPPRCHALKCHWGKLPRVLAHFGGTHPAACLGSGSDVGREKQGRLVFLPSSTAHSLARQEAGRLCGGRWSRTQSGSAGPPPPSPQGPLCTEKPPQAPICYFPLHYEEPMFLSRGKREMTRGRAETARWRSDDLLDAGSPFPLDFIMWPREGREERHGPGRSRPCLTESLRFPSPLPGFPTSAGGAEAWRWRTTSPSATNQEALCSPPLPPVVPLRNRLVSPPHKGGVELGRWSFKGPHAQQFRRKRCKWL